jgi:hydroxymethylglutaryl-CoA lyase
MNQTRPERVRIVEVGPRDGLQNEKDLISTESKVAFIDALSASGLREVEVTSFVNPKAIPQMVDAREVLELIKKLEGVRYSVLVPNAHGLDDWLEIADMFEPEQRELALFTAASETFNRRNTNVGIQESLDGFAVMVERLERELGAAKPFIRGYVSTVVRCPYEGRIAPDRVAEVAVRLLDMGVDEISLGDTIGVATPADIDRLLDVVTLVAPVQRLALHLHDTRGTALANVLAGLNQGVSVFDSAAAGLGGCPFAPGASGNLATEDLVYMLEGMGVDTGVDLKAIARASELIRPFIGHALPSRELQALRAVGF